MLDTQVGLSEPLSRRVKRMDISRNIIGAMRFLPRFRRLRITGSVILIPDLVRNGRVADRAQVPEPPELRLRGCSKIRGITRIGPPVAAKSGKIISEGGRELESGTHCN